MPNKMYLVPVESVELLRKVSQDMHDRPHDGRKADEVDYSVDAVIHGIDIALKELGLDRLMQEQTRRKGNKPIETSKLIKALRQHESGCIGCGYEHHCTVNGCVLMQQAADALEKQKVENQ